MGATNAVLRLRLPLPRFLSAGEVFTGKGSLGALRGLDAARAAVIVSGSLLKVAGMSEKIAASIQAHDVRVWSAPTGEPTLEKLAPLLAELNAFQPDWIVAIGGGSVIDAAKLLWVFYEHPDLNLERATRPFALPALRGKARFVAAPTTAGTGSEVSSSAVFGDERGRKIPLVSHDLLPDVVVLDPALVAGVPPAVAVSAGLDALAHAVEGYVSRFANPLADVFAETATRTLLEKLPAAIARRDDLDLQLEVMHAAMLAGWVQNLKVPGVGHALAHQLGSLGIAHGAACGALLVASVEFNATDDSVRRRYDKLASAIGASDTNGLVEKLRDIRRALGATAGLASLAAGGRAAIAERKSEILAGALADVCARANPRTLDATAAERVLNAAMEDLAA